MKYEDLRKRLLEFKKENGLINGIKLDKATTVFDAEKFLDSHITYLESEERKKKQGKRVCSRQIKPHFERLLKYLNECENLKKNN